MRMVTVTIQVTNDSRSDPECIGYYGNITAKHEVMGDMRPDVVTPEDEDMVHDYMERIFRKRIGAPFTPPRKQFQASLQAGRKQPRPAGH